MKRPLFLTVVSFLFGAVCAEWLPPQLHPAWMLLPFCLLLPIFLKASRSLTFVLPLFLMAGLFYAHTFHWLNQPTLDRYVGESVTLQGKVLEEPVWKKGTVRFRLQIEKLQVHGRWLETDEEALVRVRMPHDKMSGDRMSGDGSGGEFNKGAYRSPWQYGDILLLRQIELAKPEPARNPGAFDAREYYGRQGIHYAVSPKPAHLQIIGHDDRGFEGRLLLPLRQRLLLALDETFSPAHSALVAGLVLGVVDEIDEEVMDSFRLLGVVHILAVSGANVALIVLPLLAFTKRLRLPSRRRYGLAILVVLLFIGVTGAEPSVVRAGTMSIIWCLGRMVSRTADPLTSLAISGACIVLFDTEVLSDIGFQLTCGITLGLLLLPPKLLDTFNKMPLLNRAPAPLKNILAITLTAELLSVPLVLTLNPSFTPMSFLANLYIVPILALLVPLAVITLLLALLHPVIGQLPAYAASVLLDLLTNPILFAAQTKWLVRNYQAPSALWLCGYYAFWLLYAPSPTKQSEQEGTAWNLFVDWRKHVLRVIAALLLISLLHREYASQPLRVTFLDVGQGDSILIETPRKNVWLIDGGGIPSFYNSDYDIGARIVVPALASKGIDTIDVLVITHPDDDHVRGLEAVVENFEIKQVIVSTTDGDEFYQGLLQQIQAKGTPIFLAKAQSNQTWVPEEGLTIRFHNPPGNPFKKTRSDTNANSVVFTMQYGAHRFLFTGDIEGEVESKLPPIGPVDVLKVAHHGSAHSTTSAFLQTTFPTHAIISAGVDNRYGHPSPDTMKRLQQTGATIWQTPQNGAIRFESDGKTMQVTPWLNSNETDPE